MMHTPHSKSTKAEGSILVIDDEPFVCKAMRRLLRAYHVTTALTVAEGLDAMSSQHYDIVFCDLHMEDANGQDFFEEVKNRWPGSEAKIVFMTGGIFDNWSKDFLREIENEKVNKPFDIQQVRLLVRRYLQPN